jgi:hypothetical protein
MLLELFQFMILNIQEPQIKHMLNYQFTYISQQLLFLYMQLCMDNNFHRIWTNNSERNPLSQGSVIIT